MVLAVVGLHVTIGWTLLELTAARKAPYRDEFAIGIFEFDHSVATESTTSMEPRLKTFATIEAPLPDVVIDEPTSLPPSTMAITIPATEPVTRNTESPPGRDTDCPDTDTSRRLDRCACCAQPASPLN